MTYKITPAALVICLLSSCGQNISSSSAAYTTDSVTAETVINVDSSKFLSAGLAEPISIVTRTLSTGATADCYKIVSKNTPTDHQMGPWCPTNIVDDKSKGGIWMYNGNVYDVDGAFIKNLASFYKDTKLMMYDKSTGKITRTLTKADCDAAANPNVGKEYENYCVECLPSYVSTLTQTIYIPVKPVKLNSSFKLGGGGPPPGKGDRPKGPPPGGKKDGPPPPRPDDGIPTMRGIAFNGVRFDAPAPVNSILSAYTVAPFDDAGGHINLHAGYHYHAAMGASTKIIQKDGHAAMIGYAIDGHGLYEFLDVNGKEATGLDACRGHYDKTRGYHYHVDKAGTNNFINCLNGAYAK